MALTLRYAARTNLGLGPKSRNEDSAYAGPHLLVLADGMGGHAAGDVASSMIVGHLAPLDEEAISAEQALDTLETALREANEALADAMDERPELHGMGSTTIAMLRAGSKLAMAHIGDSRAYLLRGESFAQITKDHSFVQQLVDDGRITAQEALHHPQRSYVTRVMTGHDDDSPDLSMRELKRGDRYLLCSDGLSDFVGGDIIEEIVRDSATVEIAADRLISIALKASARDNITVVLADAVDTDDAPSTTPQVVGAAGLDRTRTKALPVTPAEKAAALTRAATADPDAADDGADDGADDVALADQNPNRRRRVVRTVLASTLVLLLLVGGSAAAYQWSQQQYFVGVSADPGPVGGTTIDHVAIYRGVPQRLGPVSLSHLDSSTPIGVANLPTHYQSLVRAGIPVANRTEANERVEALRVAEVECLNLQAVGIGCGPEGGPAPTGAVTTSPTAAPTTGPTTATSTAPPATTGAPSIGMPTVITSSGIVITFPPAMTTGSTP